MAFHIQCDGFGRRDFLKAGALTLGGLSMGTFLRMSAAGETNPAAKAKSAIFINLAGGPSHMDTFDLKPNAPDTHRGEFKTIQTSVSGIEISEHLPNLATAMDKFVILRGVSHSIAAHNLGSEYVNCGNRPLPSLEFPGYSSVISKELGGPADLPQAVAIPNAQYQRGGYLGVKYAPLNTGKAPTAGQAFAVRGVSLGNGLTIADVEKRQGLLNSLDTAFTGFEKQNQLLDGLDRFSQQAYSMITSPNARKAFDISQENAEFAGKFGTSGFGQSCLLALRLIESGVRFTTITNGGWDTHNDGFTALKNKQLPPFDQGLAALLNGLAQRGLLESTAVYVTGEFGRTPKINTQRVGRDHYPRAMFMLMAGGGIKGGTTYGASDRRGAYPKTSPVTASDIIATIYHGLGIPADMELRDKQDRPLVLVPEGSAIRELFA